MFQFGGEMPETKGEMLYGVCFMVLFEGILFAALFKRKEVKR